MIKEFDDFLCEMCLMSIKKKDECKFSLPLNLGTPVVSKLSELIHFYIRGLGPSKYSGHYFVFHWLDPMGLSTLRILGEQGLMPTTARYKWSWKLNKAVRV